MNFKQLLLSGLLCIAVFSGSIAQTISYSKVPQDLQLYPRDAQDSAIVEITGTVVGTGADTIMVEIFRDNVSWKILKQVLVYSSTNAPFSLSPKIFAELAEYKFEIFWGLNSVYTLDKTIDKLVSGDVFLINGQSNAMANTGTNDYEDEYCRSFGMQTDWDTYNPADTLWGYARGYTLNWQEPNPFGVGAWGIHVMRRLRNEYQIPMCFLNGAANGSQIIHHFKNPSDPMELTEIYGRLLYRATKAGIAQHVKAIFWYQGESNTDGNGRSDGYTEYFDSVYYSWKEDYPTAEKIFMCQIRPGCQGTSGEGSSELREYQRQIAKKYDDIEIMSTVGIEGFGNDQCHYEYEGYKNIAYRLYKLAAHHIYGKTFTENISPPNLKKAYYTDNDKNQITLEFNGNLVWQDSMIVNTSTHYLKDYFFLDGEFEVVDSVTIIDSTLYLNLKEPSLARTINYLPDMYYNNTSNMYLGPWLWGEDTIAALTFADVTLLCQDNDYPVLEGKLAEVDIIDGDYSINVDTIKATDPDDDGLSYEIVEGNEDSTFIIDNSTGIVTLSKLPSKDLYLLKVKATDDAVCSLSTTVTTYVMFTFKQGSGLENTENNSFNVYPNPSNGEFTISTISDIQSIKVFDISGKLVYNNSERQASSGLYRMNLENVSSGLYFVEITNNKSSYRKKIIIE